MATAAEETSATADAAHAEDVAHASAGHHDVGYYALYFLFLSLVLGALARGATRHSRLPYTVALLFVGLALGFLHSYVDLGALGDSLDIWVDIGPHTMLSCFLPALVFESAFSLEWHTFRRCASQVIWLAGPGVLMGTGLMGALLKATIPYDWGWGSSLMLGSILSATDPVAVRCFPRFSLLALPGAAAQSFRDWVKNLAPQNERGASKRFSIAFSGAFSKVFGKRTERISRFQKVL